MGPPYDSPPYDCTPPAGVEELCRGDDLPLVMAHSVWANEAGTRAYLSEWDAGMIILDISDPARPLMLGRGAEPLSDEGNLHSAVGLPGEQFVVTTDEDFTADGSGNPWGGVRIWDISDPYAPQQVASYGTPNSLTAVGHGINGGPYHTAHNPELHGNLLYLSWYADGVRVLDITNPAAPAPVAAYVPSRANIWGVHVQGNLIFLSDIQRGLYVIEQTDCR